MKSKLTEKDKRANAKLQRQREKYREFMEMKDEFLKIRQWVNDVNKELCKFAMEINHLSLAFKNMILENNIKKVCSKCGKDMNND